LRRGKVAHTKPPAPTPLGVLRRSILGHASARKMQISAVNCACAPNFRLTRCVRTSLNARLRSGFVVLFSGLTRCAIPQPPRAVASFATDWRLSLTHTMTSSATACCHHAVGGSIADFAAEGPLRMRPTTKSMCPSAWRRLIRTKRTTCSGRILWDAANFCRITQQTERNLKAHGSRREARCFRDLGKRHK
jgi:hypothetical protein